MAKAVPFIVLYVAVLGISYTRAQTGWKRTGVYEKQYIDGNPGKCSLSAGNNIICLSKWIISNSDVTYSKTEVALNAKRCHYYKKTISRNCYAGSSKQLVCTKKMTSYHINAFCDKVWLNWGECDHMCGGGTSTRIKLTKSKNSFSYDREFETRQCNTHPCPQWSEWKPMYGGSKDCDFETCSRMWSRNCIYDGKTDAEPCLKYFNISAGNNSNSTAYNSTHEIRPCHPSECTRPTTTTMEPITTAVTSNFSLVIPLAKVWSNKEDTAPNSSHVWMGIATASLVVMCILLLACFAALKLGKYQSDEHGFTLKFKKTFARKRENATVQLSNISRNPNTATNEGDEYLQPTVRDFSHPTAPIPPPPLENGTFSSVDGTYCVVPYKNQNGLDCSGNPIPSNADGNAAQGADDIYSDIPAYQRQESVHNNAIQAQDYEDNVQEYQTSEFDSCTDEELDDTTSPFIDHPLQQHRGNSLRQAQEDDEDCGSFDSDERRDIVKTLRKKSKRKADGRRPNSFNDNSDSGSEENDISTHDITRSNSSRSAAYAKLQRRNRNENPQQFRTPRSDWDNDNYESPLQSTPNADFSFRGREEILHQCPPYREDILPPNPSRGYYMGEKRRGNSFTENSRHQLLARHSSGGSSISSYFDPATSDYHSAIGDSLDGDRDFRPRDSFEQRMQGRFAERTPSLLSRLSYDRPPMKLPTSSSYCRVPSQTKKKSSSLITPKISSQIELHRSRASSIPTNCRYGRGRNNRTHGIMNYPFPRSSSSSNEFEISTERKTSATNVMTSDEYNDPLDARTPAVKDVTYTTYKLPINAITTEEDEKLV